MLISAHAFGGVPHRAISAVLGEAEPCVTEALLREYRDVPHRLFSEGKIQREQWHALVSGIGAFASAARVVVAKEQVRICRDPKDDMLLECCRAANASALITGDRDLLALTSEVKRLPGLRRLRIVTPRSYLESRQTRRSAAS